MNGNLKSVVPEKISLLDYHSQSSLAIFSSTLRQIKGGQYFQSAIGTGLDIWNKIPFK